MSEKIDVIVIVFETILLSPQFAMCWLGASRFHPKAFLHHSDDLEACRPLPVMYKIGGSFTFANSFW